MTIITGFLRLTVRQGYDNLAGVFVGNEVLNFGLFLSDSALVSADLVILANGSTAAPYIKAAARDVKAYRDSKGYRAIPIGYSAGTSDTQ